MSKTYGMRLVEMEKGRTLEQLIEAGIERGMNVEQLAADFGVSRSTLVGWCRRLGVRLVSRTVMERSGELAGAGR